MGLKEAIGEVNSLIDETMKAIVSLDSQLSYILSPAAPTAEGKGLPVSDVSTEADLQLAMAKLSCIVTTINSIASRSFVR